MFDVPIALFVYNRPELSQKVFPTIRSIKPKKIFIVADGPKDSSEASFCEQARSLFTEGIDWPCQVSTNFSSENIGTAKRVSSGLDWVFGHVDRAIILEDDILPDVSFFEFCRQLLTRYEKEETVMHINGTNIAGKIKSKYSYGFSRHAILCWGWASWARAWGKYDFSMSFWDEGKTKIQNLLGNTFPFWETILGPYKHGLPGWDLQWNVCLWKYDGLSVIPSSNLVSNIGFGEKATYTGMTQSTFSNMERIPCTMPLYHPLDYSENFDQYIEPRLIELLEEIKQFHLRYRKDYWNKFFRAIPSNS